MKLWKRAAAGVAAAAFLGAGGVVGAGPAAASGVSTAVADSGFCDTPTPSPPSGSGWYRPYPGLCYTNSTACSADGDKSGREWRCIGESVPSGFRYTLWVRGW